MRQSPTECKHVLVILPDGSLFDGGVGVHDLGAYKRIGYDLVVMEKYDLEILHKHSHGLNRTYPVNCPDFSISKKGI